jgi:hypothetical protein
MRYFDGRQPGANSQPIPTALHRPRFVSSATTERLVVARWPSGRHTNGRP